MCSSRGMRPIAPGCKGDDAVLALSSGVRSIGRYQRYGGNYERSASVARIGRASWVMWVRPRSSTDFSDVQRRCSSALA